MLKHIKQGLWLIQDPVPLLKTQSNRVSNFRDFMCSLFPSQEDFKHPVCQHMIFLNHNLITQKLTDLLESMFQRKGSPYFACNGRNAFLTSSDQNGLIMVLSKRL